MQRCVVDPEGGTEAASILYILDQEATKGWILRGALKLPYLPRVTPMAAHTERVVYSHLIYSRLPGRSVAPTLRLCCACVAPALHLCCTCVARALHLLCIFGAGEAATLHLRCTLFVLALTATPFYHGESCHL